MVESPFRYKKPRQPSIWIGGNTIIGEGSSVAETFRGMFGSGKPPENDDDVEESPCERDDDVEPTPSSTETEDSENDEVTKETVSLSKNYPRMDSNGHSLPRMRSIMKSLSPRRNTRDCDNKMFNLYNRHVPLPEDDSPRPKRRPRSVLIGGQTILGEDNNHHNRGSMINSLDSDTMKKIDEIDLQEEDTSEFLEGTDTDGNDNEVAPNPKHSQHLAYRYAITPPKERRAATAGEISLQYNNNRLLQSPTADGFVAKRRRGRLSKRAKMRLTMRERSHIQPGRHYKLESMPHSFEKRKAITWPKILDFFRRVEIKLIALIVSISAAITGFVLLACPESWQRRLEDSSLAVSILGAFLSFALVFRTQTCYSRWWEARSNCGRMTSSCVQLAGQARNWFGDEVLVDTFLTHIILFPYACKAVLRGNPLNETPEEGPRLLNSGMLTDADLGAVTRNGTPPFVCLEIMRRTLIEALREENGCKLPTAMLNGAFLAMEHSISDLYHKFGACLKINNTRMPASYTVFMRSYVIFFFVLASLSWAPRIRWLTPIITGFMISVIDLVVVIGDQMMQPFDLQWSGLPLQKFCVIIEQEVMNVSRRHADINSLFTA